MVRYFVNWSPGLRYGVDYIILEYRYRTVTENRYRGTSLNASSIIRWFELTW